MHVSDNKYDYIPDTHFEGNGTFMPKLKFKTWCAWLKEKDLIG